jgi:hypothetical protein
MKSLLSRFRNPTSHPSKDKENILPVPPKSKPGSTKQGKSQAPQTTANTTLRTATLLEPQEQSHTQSSSSDESTRPHSIAGEILPVDYEVWEEGVGEGDDDRAERGRDVEHTKKVTFKSPVPTPTTSVVLDSLDIPSMADADEVPAPSLARPPSKGGSPSKTARPAPISRPSTSVSLTASRPRPTSRASYSFLHSRPSSTRKTSAPPPITTPISNSPSKSCLSPTPSEHSAQTSLSTRSYVTLPNSWSEMAEEDLIANLGPRERTRQEVLWEIVSSEERWVSCGNRFHNEHPG